MSFPIALKKNKGVGRLFWVELLSRQRVSGSGSVQIAPSMKRDSKDYCVWSCCPSGECQAL